MRHAANKKTLGYQGNGVNRKGLPGATMGITQAACCPFKNLTVPAARFTTKKNSHLAGMNR
jgi:hypothetical protein